MTVSEILQAVEANEPFKGLPNLGVTKLVPIAARQGTVLPPINATEDIPAPGPAGWSESTAGPFDAKFDLQFDGNSIVVYVEAKTSCTPKQVEQIAPWLVQMKAMRKDAAFALVCPALSPRSQSVCIEKAIDFIDLAGNFSIKVPGKLLIQRTGQKTPEKISASFYRNPFSGKSSRILRVLLQNPKSWTLREITEELENQTRRAQRPELEFQVSSGFASRVFRSLEEQLLVVSRRTGPGLIESLALRKQGQQPRRDLAYFVPEPKRLLDTWAEKYKERFRWNMRSAVTLPNPFGPDTRSVQTGLRNIFSMPANVFEPVPVDVVAASTEVRQTPLCYAFTSAAATSVTAPFVDADVIDLFIADKAAAGVLQKAITGPSTGPELRVIPPYDEGVFLYAGQVDGVPIVSDIQAYLDLYARGGRDLKQADYLFEKRIAPAWVRQ